MPALSVTREEFLRECAEVENALFDGYAPPGKPVHGSHKRACLRIAAARLGVGQQALRNRIGAPGEISATSKHLKVFVDWSMYRKREKSDDDILRDTVEFYKEHDSIRAAARAAGLHRATFQERLDRAIVRGMGELKPVRVPPAKEESPDGDPIDLRRLRDDNARLRAAVAVAERRAAAAENYRADVLGLRDLAPPPIRFGARSKSGPSSETIILFLSDLHWGEKVWLEAMDGLNSYSLEIAQRRLVRWTHTVCDLATKHWSGPPPDRIVLILGGDLISGAIHPDFSKTDELKPLPSVRDLAIHLEHAITTIHANVACAIDVISLPGNHGRTTLKPESKEVAATSHDTLCSDFLELSLRGKKGISFFAPPSPDALFSVYGWHILATHGDRIGSRGGQGFIGPAATAARGLKRMIADYSARGIHLDLIVIGHFHCPLQLEEGLVNGSLPGPTEYSRDGRYRPHPAMQLYFTMHPRRRLAQVRWIEVGDPSEGSLYEPPPVDRPLRPRFRVQAVMQKV